MINFLRWVWRYLVWTTTNSIHNWKHNWSTIRWSVYAGVPDWWHWGLKPLDIWYDGDKGDANYLLHFTSCGVATRLGPFVAYARGDDT